MHVQLSDLNSKEFYEGMGIFWKMIFERWFVERKVQGKRKVRNHLLLIYQRNFLMYNGASRRTRTYNQEIKSLLQNATSRNLKLHGVACGWA